MDRIGLLRLRSHPLTWPTADAKNERISRREGARPALRLILEITNMASWRLRSRRCVAFAFLAVLASLDAAVLTQTKPEIEVRGVVVDGVTGRPVEGVRVTLIKRVPAGQEILNQSTFTDDRGAFLLLAPVVGEYSLSASRESRAFGAYGQDAVSGPQRWFRVSGATGGIQVKLWNVPQVNGRVLDENEQPLARVLVYALRVSVLGDRPVLKIAGASTTGTNGTYSVDVIRPGRHLLVAVPRLNQAGPARAVQYYPAARTASAAVPLELVKGHSKDAIDFHLRRERGFVISGVVQLPPDLEGPNSVDLFDASSEELPGDFPIATASLSKLGTFRFPPVAAGSYEIRFVRYAKLSANGVRDGAVRYNDQGFLPERLAKVPDGQTWWAAERTTLVDKDVTVAVPLKPGVRVTGRMVFEGPGERPDRTDLPTRGVYLRSVDYLFFRPIQVGSATEDGTFNTVAVPPGRYVLGMMGAFGGNQSYDAYQLESVKVEGREVGGVSFDLNHDVHNVVLTFSSRPTVLAGSVAGKPGQQRFALIWPADEALWTGRGTQLGRVAVALTAEGAYSLSVFPGTYRVVALDGVPPADWESSEYLRSLVGVSEQVTVTRGQTVVRNLKLAPSR